MTPSETAFPFDAVLFDLDGVIIDTTNLHYRLWTEFSERRGHAPTQDDLIATNGRRAEETIRNWFGADVSDHVVADMLAEREKHGSELLAIEPLDAVPGVQKLVAALKESGVPLAVATSAIPVNAQLSLERVGLGDSFEVIITAFDVRKGKPDFEGYLKAAEGLAVEISRCLVVEDSVNGILAGKAAGAKVLALTTTFPAETLSPLRPDWLIGDFNGLPPAVVLGLDF